MTAKNFKAIADIIQNTDCIEQEDCLKGERIFIRGLVYEDLVNNLSDYFTTTNAKFDKDRFLKACGVVVDE
jgi:hypothetical protein